jgi:hypothetical protein
MRSSKEKSLDVVKRTLKINSPKAKQVWTLDGDVCHLHCVSNVDISIFLIGNFFIGT